MRIYQIDGTRKTQIRSIHDTTVLLSILLCSLAPAWGQTQIDLARQARGVDFTQAPYTKPVKTGSSLPPSCTSGEVFLNPNAPAQMYVCAATNTWSVAGGQGSQLAQLPSLLSVSYTTANVLTVGAECSSATPCRARIGDNVFSYVGAATATVSGGTGTAYFYVSSAGVLTVGHNLTVTCSGGCVAQTGVTAFPAGSIPIGVWGATTGVWDGASAIDSRALLARDAITTDVGLRIIGGGSAAVLSVDQAVVGLRRAAPATPTTSCVSGSWAADAAFYYICVAPNTWRRVGVTLW
ncbi:MAG: hypothetical protein HYZ57_13610 [Acidobacteria bacterium]|nr:hypothetical protein [Acidobacteriota bacterium]